MLVKRSNGISGIVFPTPEEKVVLIGILSLLVMPRRIRKDVSNYNESIFDSGYLNDQEIFWVCVVLRTLLVRHLNPFSKWHTESSPKVFLPADRHAYELRSLIKDANVYLMEVFGRDRITYQRSKKIILVLNALADYRARGYRRTKALFLRDPFLWKLHDGVRDTDRLDVLLAEFCRIAEFQWSSNGRVCFRKDDEDIIVDDLDIGPLQEELDRINDYFPESMKQLFRIDWIWGENQLDHNRLYSRFCNAPKKLRAIYLRSFDFGESDITAAHWRILYLIHTGKPFSHEVYGEDLYTYLASKVWPEYPHPEHYRSIVKEILALSIGASRNVKTNSVLDKVSEELAKIGVGIGKDVHKEYMKNAGRSWTVYLTKSRMESRWSDFCSEKCKKFDAIPRPEVDPQTFLDVLYTEPVVKENMFVGIYKTTMWVETLCNIQLLQWGRDNGIVIATIHDCAYMPKENEEQVREKQEDFLRRAARVYRMINAYQKKYNNKWKLRKLTDKKRQRIAKTCLRGCSEATRNVYAGIVAAMFIPAKPKNSINAVRRKLAKLKDRCASILEKESVFILYRSSRGYSIDSSIVPFDTFIEINQLENIKFSA